jgi:hypothetical protein
MKVYGQLEKAQLENTTSDTASHPKGMVTYRTDLNQAKVSNGTAYKLLIDEDSTQTLSNKTYASPATTGAVTSAQTTTPANPSSGSNKLYFKADGKLYTLDSAGNEALVGSGAGGGVKNLITNGSADDTSSSIFVPYADAAATRPVDGTGGSPTVTTSVTSSSPLAGTKSFLLTKTAVNSQGQGWAIPFTVDTAYKAKALKISVDYIVNSGTFVAGSNGTSPTDGDLIWTIYDVTNSQIIEPSNIKMFSNSSSLSDKFEATFQTSATGSSYRLIAHVASTSALAFELKVDNVTVSPQTYVYGTPVTDWVSYTPTFTGFGTPSSVSFKSRRVGDSLQVEGYFVTGTNTGTTAQITAGYGGANANVTIDTSKVPAGGVIGEAIYSGTATTYFATYPLAPSANQTYINLGIQNSTTSALTATNGNTFANSSTVTVKFEVPIVGWSSSVQMSDSADTRVVAARYTGTTTAAPASITPAIIPLVTKVLDTHGAYNTTSGLYTVLVEGTYEVTFQTHTTVAASAVSNSFDIAIYKNGVSIASKYETAYTTTNVEHAPSITASAYCKVGDTLAAYIGQNLSGGTLTLSNSIRTYLDIKRVAGPVAIAASEKVSILYQTDSGQSLTSGGSTIIYEDKLKDSHNAYNASTGIFTAPRSGDLKIAYSVASLTVADSEFTSAIQKNGNTIVRFSTVKNPSLSRVYPSHVTSIPVVAGDQVKIVNVDAHAGASVYASSADNTLAMWMD